ncbi:MAG: leucine-rich repeat domain-containing protein [Oscillospiraceae bacterium]|nr:leucine-rich repeat domain-containing protein [Oscillospiraceae bacterium]
MSAPAAGRRVLGPLIFALVMAALGAVCALPASAAPPALWDPSAPETAAVTVRLSGSGGRVWRIDPLQDALPPALPVLRDACPPFLRLWTVVLRGREVPCTARDATFPRGLFTQAEIEAALDWLPHLERADLCALYLENDTAEALTAARPDLRLVWMVNVLDMRLRSDIQCFSTLQDSSKPPCTDRQLEPLLRCCTELRALDLGHNRVRDLSLIGKLKHLQVLVIADNPVQDLTPLENLTELEYLEMFQCNYVEDFSPLGALANLRCLNAGFCVHLTDLDFLDGLERLEMAWFPAEKDHFSAELRRRAEEKHPDTRFLFDSEIMGSTADGWRATERNVAIRRAFVNWPQVLSFESWDEVTYREGAWLTPVHPMQH